MKKQAVIDFFDMLAPTWDEGLVHNDAIIGTILDNANVREGCDVLDVACGTGVLVPDYLSRKVKSVTAVDISSEMVRIAREKFQARGVDVRCADVEFWKPEKRFDCVVVYNAFPHFPDPENLIAVLSGFLKPGGTLTVAHGGSRAAIDAHHSGRAADVSVGLMHEDDLAAIFEKHLRLTVKISDDRMYQVAGVKKE